MPVLEDTLYYSNIRSGVHEENENEREALVQEQRYCRAQARKLFLETNRRQKALEERRKQWDVQEQRLRENILQQRHQRVQDATENFQRAHLPPSQRKRPAFKRRTPNLDEALHHIQGSLHLYIQQSPFLASGSTISRSCTPSPKPSGGARHLRALSAAEAYTKLLQEKSPSNFKDNQLLFLSEQQETQKEKEQADLQESSHSETESLSSLDSLENGDTQKTHDTTPVCCSHQSTTCTQSFYLHVDPPKLQDPKSSPSPFRQSKNPLLTSHPYCSIAKSFLEEFLNQESKLSLNSPSTKDHESTEENRSLRNCTQERFDNSEDQLQTFNTQSTHGCQKELTQQDLAANSEHMTHDNDRNAQGNLLKDKGSVVAHCKTQALPDTTPLEFSSLTKDFKSESKQQTRTLEEKYAKHLSETQTAPPASRCKHSDSSFEAFSSSSAHLSSPNIQPIEELSSSQSHKHKPDVYVATGLKIESKPLSMEESIGIDSSKPKNETDVTKLTKAGVLKPSKIMEEPNRTSADPMTHSAPNNNVRFLKGILKNHLKSKSGNVKFTYTPGHLLFTKEVAILIRDSVELARAKLNEPEQNRTIKKKLRWFDEVDGVEGVDRVFRDPSRRANLPQQTHKQLLADHADHVNLLTGVSKNISNKTSAVPTGPQSTRQAWADVGPQESHTQEHIKEPTSQRRALCIGGPRTPRRARSDRVGSCPVTSRARKGTIIRPQSAREAQHVAKTQGKTLVPRPPLKPEAVECNLAECPVYISKASCNADGVLSRPDLQDLALYKDTPDRETIVHQPTLRTDAVCAPVPPYCTYTHETGICSLSPPDVLADNARRRCGENGICLDRTPTDEEITLLWHGVRSALASKDGPLSSSPQVCASLSHVTINGDSLISGVNGASKMGGFFLSSSNVRSPIRRQCMESNMVKSRVSVENSRNQPVGTTQRKPSFPYKVTVPKPQHPNKNSHAADSEGPEASDSAHEVVDCAQTHKFYNSPIGPLSQRIQSLSVSALSLEEQKILQSLERLNQRLQYVQDTAGGNPAVKGIFALGPAFNQTGESVGVTVRRRGASADNRTQTQQRC
ncbi:centrosomal protein of 126 kDa-like isoform X2 [Sinocyclocheilus anshuiensis]|uniref:centrosomal protein of 126 kDa-like isoform X2 n=1 Tax=Sinocyclocheilus anshuiensis TaxID=1608454 RepID=UPI0007B8D27C|nr:PREDICTED: centrosomal protein of 126 kDa-like isoform X2 [Sinocyclocheilus anshuiensis]